MGKISASDFKSIVELRKFGVLADVDPHRLPQKEGVIATPCADGDQMIDVFTRQVEYAAQAGHAPRPHMLALNGGALLIAEDSPLNKKLREDLVYIEHIKGGIMLKGMRTIVLYTHAPCGAAGLVKLSFVECIELLIKAKARISSEIPDAKVVCFCHIDRETDGKHKKNTYFVDEERWAEWQRKHPMEVEVA
ncbi:MAG: hypothetical protein Q8Q39_01310 [bacterium]|nr:hypothetical protein [bacterium]